MRGRPVCSTAYKIMRVFKQGEVRTYTIMRIFAQI